jgi:hypothetical protein
MPLMNPAPPCFAQKHAAAIGSVIELIVSIPRHPDFDDWAKPPQIGLNVPTLGIDLFLLRLGDADVIFLATGAGLVAIPVLDQGQMTD